MNLHARAGKETIDLWQTPTSITRMCLMSSKGIRVTAKGKAARRALRIYLEWVRGTLDGAWTSTEALEDMKESVQWHTEYVSRYLDNPDLEVYEL